MNSWFRFALPVVLIAGAALFLHARSGAEVLPARNDLSGFPLQIDDWKGENQGIAPRILEALGPGEFLSRLYQRSPREPSINLFIAYFPSQRTGDTIHSPKNCLPGAGWTPLQASQIVLKGPHGSEIPVNRYILANGGDRLLVLYWYQAHGRAVASEYWAKFYLVADAIRMNRTDGALVRVITPLANGERAESAQQRETGFISAFLPSLNNYMPK